MLLGLSNQGVRCNICKLNCHKECGANIPSDKVFNSSANPSPQETTETLQTTTSTPSMANFSKVSSVTHQPTETSCPQFTCEKNDSSDSDMEPSLQTVAKTPSKTKKVEEVKAFELKNEDVDSLISDIHYLSGDLNQ
eukprot:Pgem_evm1s9189